MRVARIIPVTRAEGPGKRFCLWVQGCHIGCPGCYATALQDPNGGYEISVEEIISDLENYRNEVEGITLLGGEPMEQAAELSALAEAAQKSNLSVITFTGYTYDDLLGCNDGSKRDLLQHTDILLSGPYLEAERDFSRPLVGSKNQEIHFLSDRYTKKDFFNYHNRFEIRVLQDGSIQLNGMGDLTYIKNLLEGAY